MKKPASGFGLCSCRKRHERIRPIAHAEIFHLLDDDNAIVGVQIRLPGSRARIGGSYAAAPVVILWILDGHRSPYALQDLIV